MESESQKVRRITIERTPCYGTCPVYKVEILGSGHVTYFGEIFVSRTGIHTWTISLKKVKKLVEVFERANYFTFKDEYTSFDYTCMSSCLTSIEYEDGKSKAVNHYHGDMSVPKELEKLEDKIDRIVGVDKCVRESLYIYSIRLNISPEFKDYYEGHIIIARNENEAFNKIPLGNESKTNSGNKVLTRNQWLIEKMGKYRYSSPDDSPRVVMSSFKSK